MDIVQLELLASRIQGARRPVYTLSGTPARRNCIFARVHNNSTFITFISIITLGNSVKCFAVFVHQKHIEIEVNEKQV